MWDGFWNAFWLFLGIVSGACIQFALGHIQLRMQRRNARRLFLVETEINRASLDKLKESLKRKKERFGAGQVTDGDYFIDMSQFNYRMIDPLVNAGYFHDLLGPEGVMRYMRYAAELNISNASNLTEILRKEAAEGRSLSFLDWLIDQKCNEWDGHLQHVEQRLIGQNKALSSNAKK